MVPADPNMVGMGMAPLVGGLIMAKPAWLKLSDADRAKVQAACDRMEKRLEVEVPRQDTTAVAEMQKRGLHIVPVSAANQAQFRSEAEEFAAQLTGVRIPADIVTLARKERTRSERGRRRSSRRRSRPSPGRPFVVRPFSERPLDLIGLSSVPRLSFSARRTSHRRCRAAPRVPESPGLPPFPR